MTRTRHIVPVVVMTLCLAVLLAVAVGAAPAPTTTAPAAPVAPAGPVALAADTPVQTIHGATLNTWYNLVLNHGGMSCWQQINIGNYGSYAFTKARTITTNSCDTSANGGTALKETVHPAGADINLPTGPTTCSWAHTQGQSPTAPGCYFLTDPQAFGDLQEQSYLPYWPSTIVQGYYRMCTATPDGYCALYAITPF